MHLATGAPVKQQRDTQNFVFIDTETSNIDYRGTEDKGAGGLTHPFYFKML